MATKVAGPSFAVRFKALRGTTSQRELARSLGVSRGIIAKWEAGEGRPTYGSLERLAAYFRVPLAELVGEERKPDAGPDLREAEQLLNKLTPALSAIRQAVREAVRKKEEEASS